MKFLNLLLKKIVCLFLLFCIMGSGNPDTTMSAQQWSFGWFQVTLPPGWSYDAANSVADFFTFNHTGNGIADYVVQLKKTPVDCVTKKDFNREVQKIFYEFYGRQDYVDKFKNEGDYSALGVANCHLMTFSLKGSGERGFILSPWVNGKMFNLYIYDKVSRKKELRGDALAFINALRLNPSDSEMTAGVQSTMKEERSPAVKPSGAGSEKPASSRQTGNIAGEGQGKEVAVPASGKEGAISLKDDKKAKAANATVPSSPKARSEAAIPQAKMPDSPGDPRQGVPQMSGKPLKNLTLDHFRFESEVDFATMTNAQYAGAVSAAMEGMRLICGEMTPEEETNFSKIWLPLFKYPCREVVDYLNQLNPLIQKFIAIREVLNEEMEAYNAGVLQIKALVAGEDDDQLPEAVADLEITTSAILTLQKQMQEVADEISRLGNPPNAEALAEKQRKTHRKALGLLAGNSFPLEGLWETADGTKTLIRVIRSFEDGKVLTYHFPVTWLERMEEKGYEIHKPGIQSVEGEKGMGLIPGIYDLLHVFDPLGDGKWVSLDWSFLRSVSVYEPDETGVQILHYTPGDQLSPESSTSTYELTRLKDTITVPPVLPIDNKPAKWPDLLKVISERKWDQEKYNAYLNWLSKYPEDLPMAAKGGPTPLEERIRLYQGERKKVEDEYEARMNGDLGPQVNQNVSLRYSMAQLHNEVLSESDRPRLEKEEREKILEGIEYTRDSQLEFLRNKYSDIFESGKDGFKPQPEIARDTAGLHAAMQAWESAEAERKQKEEQIKYHENNIEYFTRNVENLRGKLDQAGAGMDASARNNLTRDLLYQQDALQREKDAVLTIRSGEYVHTRTDLDALNLQMMQARSQEMAEEAHRIKRTLERMPNLIAMAEPGDRLRLQELFRKNISSTAEGRIDVERLTKAARAIGNQVTGQLEQEAAKAEEEAALASAKLDAVEYIKTGADVSMMLLSVAAPIYYAHTAPNAIAMAMRAGRAAQVFMAYNGASGFIEGGITEAVSRAASSYNAATMVAKAAMDGYQQGVLNHLEQHAGNAGSVEINETSAGLSGMGWAAGKEAAKLVVMNMALGALMPSRPPSGPARFSDVANARGKSPAAENQKWPTIRQQISEGQFVARQSEGRAKVQIFRERALKLAEAGKANAPKEEILRLRNSMEESYTTVKTDYYAKMHVNKLSRQGDTKTAHYYNSCERTYMKKLTAMVDQEMTAAGFSKQEYRSFSNSSSKGKAGMDLDFGVVEPPRYILNAQGSKIPNPAHTAWRKGITQKMADGTVVRRSPQELQAAGKNALESSFEKVYGRPPGEAMVEFTTSYHPEAYRDLAWLGRQGSKTALVYETDPKWVQQAADVTGFKINTIPQKDPSLRYYGHLQEQARGLTKDFDTKIEPMLKLQEGKNPQAVKHLRELRNTMDALGKDQLGPVEADHKIRELTGGKGIMEAYEQFSVAMQALRKSL